MKWSFRDLVRSYWSHTERYELTKGIIDFIGLYAQWIKSVRHRKSYSRFTFHSTKGQIISKGLLVSSNSPKKRTNEFVFTTTTKSFICFLGEFENTKKSFQNYLTFRYVGKYVCLNFNLPHTGIPWPCMDLFHYFESNLFTLQSMNLIIANSINSTTAFMSMRVHIAGLAQSHLS